ncbi:MAG TPA: hypothetical protein ENH26_00450 [Candidatus Wolfebacteria bacterium]|nr:hypothetical protein [Candidatus Wolfebacteria bacterium]
MRNTLKILALPLIFFAVFVSLWLIWKIFQLPQEQELIEIVKYYFNLYGYWMVFISAIIEGVLLVGWYYPGSLVIFLGVIFAGKDLTQVVLVVSLVTVGLFLAQLFNYVLGKYGWYKLFFEIWLERANRKFAKAFYKIRA